ncbi:MAG TPA: hypothetical protein VJ249_10085 [Candidatus Bathyarchaeia archaeon]|nr:hypothetical protein [Candidatus Bathyarchaeia archaeon]
MKSKWLWPLAPFLLADTLLASAALIFLQLDLIVNKTLYEYGLTFNTNWAQPYWTTIRLGLGVLGITMIIIASIGYLSIRHTGEQTDKAKVYICKSCGESWCKPDKIPKVNGKLPMLNVLKSCASCNEKLLDIT